MAYCNAILPNGKLSLCSLHNLWQSVLGDSEHFIVFGYILKMEAFRSELLTGHY